MSNFSLLESLELDLHILTLFRIKVGRGSDNPNCFLQISFSWAKMSFHVEFHLPGLPGSPLKVFGGGGGWWVVVGGSKATLVFSFGPNRSRT